MAGWQKDNYFPTGSIHGFDQDAALVEESIKIQIKD
jgi:hypothetical protein